MRLKRLKIANYRSIQETDVDLGCFSIFVGQNNHGKTNLFEAIEWFYTAKSSVPEEHFLGNGENPISVELFFEEFETTDIEKLTTEANKTKIRNLLDGHTGFSVIKSSVDHKRKYIVNGVDQGNPQGLDTAINEFLPKLEYVNTKIRLDDVSKYKDKNPIGLMLSGVLTAIIESSTEYTKFKNQFSELFDSPASDVRKALDDLGGKVEVYLQKQFPDGTKVKFGVNPPNFTDLLKSFDTTVDDGIETKAEDKGDGMQRAIMLSIIQAFADYRKAQLGGGTFIFMIDEAELHLHPSAQRALKNALLDICETDQVLVNTHSSVFVVDDHEKQKIFKVEKTNKVSNVNEISDIEKINVIYDLLGGSPTDLLLPKNFLIVEGKCEFYFISEVVKRFYPARFKGIKILFAGGDLTEQEKSLHAVHKLFNPLAGSENPIYRDKTIVLIDKPNTDQQNKYDQFKTGYPYLFTNRQVFELPTESLEEYYPGDWKKTKAEAGAMQEEREKAPYAKQVGENITQQVFETEMKKIYEALCRCEELAFAHE